jgi:hypothetical protein
MKNILGILCLFVSFHANAQNTETNPFDSKAKKWTINAGINETVNVNLFNVIGTDNKFVSPLHPYFYAGIDRNFKVKKGNRKYYGAEIGFHNNTFVDRSFQIGIRGGANYRLYKSIYAGIDLSLAMQQSTRADIVYQFVDNQWQGQAYPADYRYNRQLLRTQVEVGYRFKKLPLEVFATSNFIFIRHYLGKAVPFNINYTPLGFGVHWHL